MAAGVSVLSDSSCSVSGAHGGGGIGAEMETASSARVPTAKYTKMGETLRHVIPGHMQCSMACGGKACKYENPSRWSDEEQAVKGLYSSWITDSLLATARPSTEIIERYNVIEQFQRCGLKTVINLQRPGEHASCGGTLEQESGFTYRPETFMEADIYYYNFGWKDYGVASLTTILDMVKVMSFAIQEGKLAVHCHAGLGRTGVLLACYLVFTARMSADQAVLFVRAKRPNSIQTRGQLLCVREFAQFLVPLRSVFSCAEPKAGAVTLSQYLTRQRHLLHGYEARQMKHVPKIVRLVCRLLVDIAADRQVPMVEEEEWPEAPDLAAEVEKTVSQQALQRLGKEMRGKGIPAPPPPPPRPLSPLPLRSGRLRDQPLASGNDLDPLWSAESALTPCLSDTKGLSYSDSVLHQRGSRERYLGSLRSDTATPVSRSLSHGSLAAAATPPPGFCDLPPRGGGVVVGAQEPDADAKRDAGSAFPHQQPDADVFPFVALPSELTPESRRLLVARALAADPAEDDLSSKVALWQAELNSREGAWERLCLERDPLVLSGLMWSWLEQLKDPVIGSEDVRALGEGNVSPRGALDSLEKGHRLTLLCVLDCAAHLLPMPEEVETGFVNQTIKAFAKVGAASEENESLHATLKAILTPVFHELRDDAADERDNA